MVAVRPLMMTTSNGQNRKWLLSAEWRWSLGIWLSLRIFLTILGALLYSADLPMVDIREPFYFGVQPIRQGIEAPLLGVWQRWDAVYYIRIADFGYNSVDLSAYFPLYPLLARQISQVLGIPSILSLEIISNLAYLFALVLLFRIVTERVSADLARRTLLITAFFPTAFFFFAPYPMSAVFLFVLLAYRATYRRRWLLAALAGLCAGLSHSTVIPLAVLLFIPVVDYLRTHPPRIAYLTLLVPGVPFLGTAIFLLWRTAAGFPDFSAIMLEGWGRQTLFPWQTLLEIPRLFTTKYFAVSGWLNVLLLLLAVMALFWSLRRLRLELWLYMLTALLFLLSTSVEHEPLSSFNRYILLCFPLFIILAKWARNFWLRLLILGTEGLMFLYFSTMFFMWAWVG